jgi:hypothetical protein
MCTSLPLRAAHRAPAAQRTRRRARSGLARHLRGALGRRAALRARAPRAFPAPGRTCRADRARLVAFDIRPCFAGTRPPQVEELADAVARLDLAFRWVCSLGAVERDAAFESVRRLRARAPSRLSLAFLACFVGRGWRRRSTR